MSVYRVEFIQKSYTARPMPFGEEKYSQRNQF